MKRFQDLNLDVPTRIGDAKVYLVGGYVRDKLLGLIPKDADFVVVGATPQQMLNNGFSQVGADFPVFLHPVSGDEYALARTERKTAPGYHGFVTDHSPIITIEEDLMRRDLTINSMAIDLETGYVVDPYGGQTDLHRAILRHTSEAFKEDPVRILRTARFAARYSFFLHKQTRDFMLQMVQDEAMDELVPERVWAEFERGLMEKHPREMFRVLDDCEALRNLPVPWYGGLYASGLWRFHSNIGHLNLAQRFALVAEFFDSDDYRTASIPNDCVKMSSILNRWKHMIPQYDTLEPLFRLTLLSQVGAIGKDRNTDLFHQFTTVYNTWCEQRFDKASITNQRVLMLTHSHKINTLRPPEDVAGKAAADWMMAQKIQIVSVV